MPDRAWPRVVLGYALWFAILGLIVLIILVARETIAFAMVLTGWRRFTTNLTNEIVILLLGIGGIVFVVVIEHLFRTAPTYAALLRRFALAAATGLIALAGLHGLFVLVAVQIEMPFSLRLTTMFFELLGAMILLWFRGHLQRHAAAR